MLARHRGARIGTTGQVSLHTTQDLLLVKGIVAKLNKKKKNTNTDFLRIFMDFLKMFLFL